MFLGFTVLSLPVPPVAFATPEDTRNHSNKLVIDTGAPRSSLPHVTLLLTPLPHGTLLLTPPLQLNPPLLQPAQKMRS